MSPVLVATQRRDVAKLHVPSRRYFDHLIVCGSLSNGSEYCLDATDAYAGIEPTSGWIQGAVALPVAADAALTNLPQPEFGWTVKEKLESSITNEGGLTEKGVVNYGGAYGGLLRQQLVGLSSSELQDWAVADYHSAVSTLVEPEFEFNGIDEINEDLSIQWDTEYEQIVSIEDELVYKEPAAWLAQSIASLRTENKVYDYRFIGLRFESEVAMKVDERWRVTSSTPDIDMRSKFGSLRRTISITGQVLTFKTEFEAPARVVSVDELEAFEKFLTIVREESLLGVTASLAVP